MIDTMEWGIDTYAMEIVSTFPYSSWYNLMHRLIDVAFQSRILGISSLELLNNIRCKGVHSLMPDLGRCYLVTDG